MEQKKSECKKQSTKIIELMRSVKTNVSKIDEIAMKPHLFTDEDYFK